MGISIEYFAAPSDEVAGAVLDGGPRDGSRAFDVVDLKGVEPIVVMGLLESFLTEREYEVVTENPRQGYQVAYDEDGVWVVALTEELRDALTSSNDDQLRAAASALGSTPELAPCDAEDVPQLAQGLSELAALARIARARGHGLYCWMCL